MPDTGAMVILDAESKLVGYNPVARSLFGSGLKRYEPFDLQQFVGKDFLPEIGRRIRAALENGEIQPDRNAEIVDSEGNVIPCVYSVTPLFGSDFQITGVILTIRNEDPEPEEETFPNNALGMPGISRLGYETLFENLAEGMFTINIRWRINSFNKPAERITGYRREEVLGRYCWDIFRSELCRSGCPLRTTLESGITRMDQDVRILDKGGRRRGILVNTSVVREPDGRVIGAVETFRPLDSLDGPAGLISSGASFSDIIGGSPPMLHLFEMLPDVAVSEANVLIQGKSGTGKELVARAIHKHSPRNKGPFVAVNCSALAESLLESEIFGHEKAAFTGAVRSKVGRFELAKGGTLFLDEIGELKPELQVKLLRVVEQRVFERVGGTRLIPMEARIISATNRDLRVAVREGVFREDLFYRLRTVPLTIPPLKDRREDIPLLVKHFIRRLNAKYGKEVRSVDPKVMDLFQTLDWPGNVRELERVLEYAFVFVKGPLIFLSHLPDMEEFELTGEALYDKEMSGSRLSEEEPYGYGEEEREAIREALKRTGGRRVRAAELLGISRTSLWRRMKSMGLS